MVVKNYLLTPKYMKIGYFSRRFYSNSGGGEQCDVYIIEILKSLNHEVIIISENKSKKVIQAKKRNLLNKLKEEVSELSFYLKKITYLINCDLFFITGRSISAALISIFFPNKLIHNIHGKTNPLAIYILKKKCKFIYFWGNSHLMSGQPVNKKFKIDLLPSSTYLRKTFNSYKTKKENKILNKKNSLLKILWVGRLEPIKDPIFFIDVLCKLNLLTQNWNATIIGDGSLSGNVINYVDQLDIEMRSKIDIKGQVKNSEIHQFYKNKDLLAITSKSENFPIVALESLMTNLPVLSVPIENLAKSRLSSYLNFCFERDPSSMANLINNFSKNSNDYNKKRLKELKKDIVDKYTLQKNNLNLWLK